MGLRRLTDRIWYLPFERELDRPNLCYIRGSRFSVAVDAGHSEAHVSEFYRLLEGEGLALPALTIITHWHWDHSLGMHATHGLCVANARTNDHLRHVRDRVAREGAGWLLSMDESIRREYAGGRPIVVTMADVVFDGELTLDLGDRTVRAFQAESPHTDDATLVHVPEEGALLFGDAKSGTFPTWVKLAAPCRRLAEAVEATEADVCLGGHWEPMVMSELLADLEGVREDDEARDE
ncbi:MAG: MBL fold metallo-hydrolase [Coriobacteriales bacterium]|nr:MBL fold metallo-hydrolase [Coriobacteriales bacterium]